MAAKKRNNHTIHDVAARADVSVGTVSNVLNRPEVVAAETSARVRAAIQELGFVRDGSAHRLRRGKSDAVGLLVLDVASPFFAEIARGVEDAAAEAGLLVILCNSDISGEKEDRYLRTLEEQRVAGVLITPSRRRPRGLDRLRARGTAIVLLDYVGRRGLECGVAVDDVRGGRLAGEHLIERGRDRFAFITGEAKLKQFADRRKGFLAALTAAGAGDAVAEARTPHPNAAGGFQVMEELLQCGEAPNAVFCVNDLIALGVFRALRKHRLRVPDDVALVGYDDIDLAADAPVPLTSVRQPIYELGRAAMELLREEIDQEADHKHRTILFQPELVVRDSSGP